MHFLREKIQTITLGSIPCLAANGNHENAPYKVGKRIHTSLRMLEWFLHWLAKEEIWETFMNVLALIHYGVILFPNTKELIEMLKMRLRDHDKDRVCTRNKKRPPRTVTQIAAEIIFFAINNQIAAAQTLWCHRFEWSYALCCHKESLKELLRPRPSPIQCSDDATHFLVKKFTKIFTVILSPLFEHLVPAQIPKCNKRWELCLTVLSRV